MLLAILSGILTALSQPTAIRGLVLPDLGFLAWIGTVPLLMALRGASARKALRLGFTAGFVHYLICLYWFFIALHTYGSVSVLVSGLGLSAAAAIEAVFPALTCWSVALLARRRIPFVVSFPLAWVAFEFLRHHVPSGGFGWASLAYSQRGFLTFLQVLDVTGIYGILFLILLANAILEEVLAWRRGMASRAPVMAIVLFAVFMIAAVVYGRVRLPQVRDAEKRAETVSVAMVQGNVPQHEKYQEEKAASILERHLAMTAKAEAGDPDLVIWPEAAFPEVLGPELLRLDELQAIKNPLLMGVVTFEGDIPESFPPRPEDNFALHNSALFLEPGGYVADRYDKVHLVPMGEYVPLADVFFFLHQVVPDMSGFSPGRGFYLMALTPTPLPNRERGLTSPEFLGGEGVRFGVTICYEDLFPEISRTFTRRGARFLVNLTNDGWYDRSSAIFQHFDFSRYRAIENRRSMVRATNTGKTAVFSPTGEEIAAAPVFEEAILPSRVPLVSMTTVYTRVGDVFAWGCVLALALVGVASLTRKV